MFQNIPAREMEHTGVLRPNKIAFDSSLNEELVLLLFFLPFSQRRLCSANEYLYIKCLVFIPLQFLSLLLNLSLTVIPVVCSILNFMFNFVNEATVILISFPYATKLPLSYISIDANFFRSDLPEKMLCNFDLVVRLPRFQIWCLNCMAYILEMFSGLK